MIPPDLASSLRNVIPDARQADLQARTEPILPAQRIADLLGNFTPGERVFAQVQALLPNGTYRALVAQREITLALPFSAKPGDSLELEVQESDGKLTLAFIANRSASADTPEAAESAATRLSKAGQLIGNLLDGIDERPAESKATALNGNQPLAQQMPANAADLMPLLKQAITQSGVFYEAHQAKWVAGELPTEALKQEPQGKYASAIPAQAAGSGLADKAGAPQATVSEPARQAIAHITAEPQGNAPGQTIPRELVPIVQQQLDALATQNYAWQGQVWPGQQMWWEIGEQAGDAKTLGGDAMQQWQTRLKLDLPNLGGVDLTLRLQAGGRIDIAAKASSAEGEAALRDGTLALKEQLEASGLNLTQLLVRREQPES